MQTSTVTSNRWTTQAREIWLRWESVVVKFDDVVVVVVVRAEHRKSTNAQRGQSLDDVIHDQPA